VARIKAGHNCHICGREIQRACRVLDGQPYCATCAKRELVKSSCPTCGETVRIKPGTEAEICRTCATKERFCSGCGRPLPKASVVKENGEAFCYNCSLKLREPAPCARCGKVTIYLTSSAPRGIQDKICHACLDNYKKGTCPICGKFRILLDKTEFGRPACKLCTKTRGIFVCPTCRRPGKRHSADRCESCYLSDLLEKQVAAWLDAMPNGWVKVLSQTWASKYLHDAKADAKKARYSDIKSTVDFFNTLAASCRSPEDMTLLFLFETFGNSWTNSYQNAFNFLVKSALVPPRDDQAYTDIRNFQHQLRYIKMASGTWFENLLSEYHTFLQEVRERYQSRGWDSGEKYQQGTISSQMQSAYYFLLFHEHSVKSVQELREEHFYQFFKSFPGYKNSLYSGLLYFLNYKRKTFRRISLKDEDNLVGRRKSSNTSKPSSKRKGVLTGAEYARLTKRLYQCPPSEARDALICLFALLYGQMSHKIIRMRLDAVIQDPDGKFNVRFASAPLEIDEQTAKVLAMYMHQRQLQEKRLDFPNPYLFPGKAAGSHLQYDRAHVVYGQYGVTVQRAFATALIRLYQGGVTQPKVLIDGLGVCARTAVKYYELANVRIMDELLERR
jgi:hypothetical protein